MEEEPTTAQSASLYQEIRLISQHLIKWIYFLPIRNMKICNLKLTNFRNHTNLSIDFDEKLTLIEGPNGSGKTNILEAIYILGTGKSHRAHYDRDLIQYGQSFCTIEGNIKTSTDNLNLQVQIQKNEDFENASIKKVKINKVSKSVSYFTGVFNCVLFSPQDIELVTDSPSIRRKYIDTALSQISINYKRSLNSYTKALRQRNKLLEQISDGQHILNQVDFWTQKILEHGKVIQDLREYFFSNISETVKDKGKLLNTKDTNIKIEYLKNTISKNRLESYKQKEILAHTTLVGPHRDDFKIFFNEYNVSNFGSRGEQRSCVLALKLSELEFIKKEKKENPVLLLDDIFSELDEKHQHAVLDTVNNQQTTITTTADLEFLEKQGFKTISLPKN